MLKIYGFEPSTWTNAVRFTANALNMEYDFVRVNLVAGEGQRPEYLAIHPAGKVPAMDDDGFRLFESGAIMRYLARKQDSDLYPSSITQQAFVDQWSLFVSIHIASAMGKVLFNRELYKIVGAEPNAHELEEAVGFLGRFLPIIDTQLGQSSFLASEGLSIADLMLLAWLDPAEMAQVDLSAYAHVSTWRNRLKTESFYTSCHRDYADMFQSLSTQQSKPDIDARAATS